MEHTNIKNIRISWIDIAKCIAIILVIVGHTVKYNSLTRNFIFSFHMPLFFILSGYTYHFVNSWDEFWKQVKYSFENLLIPCFSVSVIVMIYKFVHTDPKNLYALQNILQNCLQEYIWASGVGFNGHPYFGALWFLISLFWAHIIINVLDLTFNGPYKKYLYFGIGILGLFLGARGKWLPQNLDVTCLAVLFIAVGIEWKKYEQLINNHTGIIFIGASTFWLACLDRGIYLEFSYRHYPGMSISILEALAGAYVICCVCKGIVDNVYVTKPLIVIGRHTLSILCFHCLDFIVLFIWNTNNIIYKCVGRIAVVLVASFLFISLKDLLVSRIRSFD